MRSLLTPIEVDDLLRYPLGKSQRLAKAGKLPHIKLPDGSIRFYPEDIDAILSGHQRTSTQGEGAAHA